MNKENTLFGIVGLLLGLIIGFIFANSINRNAAPPAAASMMGQNSNMPPGHPEIPGGAANPDMPPAPEVQAAIEKAKKEPGNFEAQMKAAEFQYQASRFDEAIGFLKSANKLKPDDPEVLILLGNANFDSDKYEEAEKWYSSALAKKADDVNVRTDLGLTFIFRDPPNYERAIQEFLRSLEKDPGHKQTIQNLIVAYTKKKDTEKAKSTLARLEGLDPMNSALPRLREEIQKLE